MKEDVALEFPTGIFDSKYLASIIASKSVYKEINKLLASGKITRIGRGQYIAANKAEYEYKPSEEFLKIEKYIIRRYPELDFRMAETYQLNWFANHQISKNIIIVETERMLTESVFYTLKDRFHVLIKPDIRDLAYYLQGGSVVVQNMVSGAPRAKDNHVSPLEKLLVDVVCDKIYRNFIQEAELRGIYENAFSSYNINRAAMLRYAGRRSCRDELVKLMENL